MLMTVSLGVSVGFLGEISSSDVPRFSSGFRTALNVDALLGSSAIDSQ